MVYPLLLLVLISAVLTLHTVFVMPKLMRIFRDFGLYPPAIMRWMADFGDTCAPTVLIVAGVVALGFLGMRLFEIFSLRNFTRYSWSLTDWLTWHAPLARGLVQPRIGRYLPCDEPGPAGRILVQ